MTASLNTHSLQRRDLPGNRIGDDIVIFDDRVGKYYAAGCVGADIWDLLAAPISLDAICEWLLQMYAIDAEECQSQTLDFLAYLEKLDLLEPVPSQTSVLTTEARSALDKN